jgi:hypothetical protein
VQVRTTVAGLEEAIKAIKAGTGALRTWVEVVVEDAILEDDLNERVLKLAEQQGVEVLKVLRGGAASLTGMSAGSSTDDEAIDTLLDQPVQVFGHLLEQHKELTEAETEQLKATFAVLLDLDAQAESTAETNQA